MKNEHSDGAVPGSLPVHGPSGVEVLGCLEDLVCLGFRCPANHGTYGARSVGDFCGVARTQVVCPSRRSLLTEVRCDQRNARAVWNSDERHGSRITGSCPGRRHHEYRESGEEARCGCVVLRNPIDQSVHRSQDSGQKGGSGRGHGEGLHPALEQIRWRMCVVQAVDEAHDGSNVPPSRRWQHRCDTLWSYPLNRRR